ncbi:hypothetical protein KR038_009756, partial [Drosophila bunnanda]
WLSSSRRLQSLHAESRLAGCSVHDLRLRGLLPPPGRCPGPGPGASSGAGQGRCCLRLRLPQLAEQCGGHAILLGRCHQYLLLLHLLRVIAGARICPC